MSAERVTVSDSAVALNTAGTAGRRLVITNTDDTNSADLGDEDVTADGGLALASGDTVSVELDPGDVLYAIRSDAADVVLAVLRT